MNDHQWAVLQHATDLSNCEDQEFGRSQLHLLAGECGLRPEPGQRHGDLVAAIQEAILGGADPWAECWDPSQNLLQWRRVSRRVMDGRARRARARMRKTS